MMLNLQVFSNSATVKRIRLFKLHYQVVLIHFPNPDITRSGTIKSYHRYRQV